MEGVFLLCISFQYSIDYLFVYASITPSRINRGYKMTTIFAHLPTATLYADTCQTVTCQVGYWYEKAIYQKQALKITTVKGLTLALFGRLDTSMYIINLLKKGVVDKYIFKKCKVPKKAAGGIIVIKKGYAVLLRIAEDRVLTQELVMGNWVALGSGADTKLFRQAMHRHTAKSMKLLWLPDVVNKVLRYNSLFDKHSNDKVTYAKDGAGTLNSIGWDWHSLKTNQE